MRRSMSDAEMHADAAGDLLRLTHHVAGDAPGAGIGGDHVEGRVGERRDRVEAEVAPQLQPDVVANLGVDARLEAARREGVVKGGEPLRGLAGRLAEAETVAVDVLDDARRDDLGGWIDGAADGALGTDGAPLPAVGINALQLQVRVLPLEAVEIPPRDTVLRGDDGRVRPEQRLHLLRHLPRLMRLERDDHVILLAELGRIGGGRHPGGLLAAVDEELEAVRPDGVEMGAARDERHVGLAFLEEDGEMPADGAGAVDADLHVSLYFRV
jgi:hypothetical protein